VTELHEIYPKSVHDLGLRPELPGLFIAHPTSSATSVMSSMTFLWCPFPVQSTTTFYVDLEGFGSASGHRSKNMFLALKPLA